MVLRHCLHDIQNEFKHVKAPIKCYLRCWAGVWVGAGIWVGAGVWVGAGAGAGAGAGGCTTI